jgi:hypothetical protein
MPVRRVSVVAEAPRRTWRLCVPIAFGHRFSALWLEIVPGDALGSTESSGSATGHCMFGIAWLKRQGDIAMSAGT